jgi:hypothetical protein
LEGFCEVNIKLRDRPRRYNRGNMEGYRPLSEHDKKMQRIRTQPRTYEYLPLPAPMREAQEQARMQDGEQSGAGLFMLALLFSLIGLPEDGESGIEAGGK